MLGKQKSQESVASNFVPKAPNLIPSQGSAYPCYFHAYDRAFIHHFRYSDAYFWCVLTSRPCHHFPLTIVHLSEIQELRHKSQASGDTAGTTSTIDQSLMNLDERLESVAKGMKSISDTLEPLLRTASTPTMSQNGDSNENAMLLRKHATLAAEWEAVQDESDVLREELKEDKWLTVFRTVTDQADGMMSSLEKAVNRCQVRGCNAKFCLFCQKV